VRERLTREECLAIVAELCPKHGFRRACDSAEIAREMVRELLDLRPELPLASDLVLTRAIDRYAAGLLDLDSLYRCRVLAYYMTFGAGGEEWERWGIAADVRPGGFTPEPPDLDPESVFHLPPPGPPWRDS
jgi:hypothetical protein